MSNQMKTHDLIRQNEHIVKKSQKHDANLQKNATIYFQIGLIACLLAALGLLEMKFETTIPEFGGNLPPIVEPEYPNVPVIKTKVPEAVKPIDRKMIKDPQTFKEVPDEMPDIFFKDQQVETKIETPAINPTDFPSLEEKPEELNNVSFVAIQNAPIYPGCEGEKNNDARKKCMSDKISKLIQRKFEGSDIASTYGLRGKQKIHVQFTIDNMGHVKDVKTRAPHPKLNEEAERVINFIPEMIPGRQHDKNVGVIYTLPIIFQVE